MIDITIPRAALEAGITAFADAEVNDYTSQAEDLATAFRAMLRAWPGVTLHQQDINAEYSYFVLPLPTEASDE